MLNWPVPNPPFTLKPGDPIRIVLTDGTVYDHVVSNVDGTTITTHLPVAYAMGGVIDKYYAATGDEPSAFLGGCHRATYSNPEDYEPDPDDLTRAQLGESDPMLRAVADALDEWLHANHGIMSSHHNAGHFWTLLHERGYQIAPNEPVSDLADVLPASTD